MRPGNREKLSVTVEPDVFRAVERHARRAGVSRSKIIADAILFWERNCLAQLAREGYEEAAGETLKDAGAYLPALADIEDR